MKPLQSSSDSATDLARRSGASSDYFATTRWTLVLTAGRQSSTHSEEALADLCRVYWYPLYAYVRRRGHSREEAEDLTQSFFARFLEKNYLDGLSSERGKFRAFLLASLKHFLANEWDKSRRLKRGGHLVHLSLDWQDADDRYHLDPPDPVSADQLYDRAWALALLQRVVDRLQEESKRAGKEMLFEHAKSFLMLDQDAVPYAEAGAKAGLDEVAMRVAVHRMRKRYRELLREEIAQTLANPLVVEEELRALRAALL